ncbi:MAG TPA: hypothetical protein VG937_01285 [Polyangiaceae bacterium]|nr:hypothetical protein [Polyangiaceae bacterium]
MSNVLGRVATGVHDVPRGPDVVHRIGVKRSWLERGEVIEFTLPRNLACAACAGGGCDRCARSGAITLRGRREPPDVITVPLPKRSSEELEREPVVVLRVPEQGGFPEAGLELPRGLLLLSIAAAAKSDAGVQRKRSSFLSLPPARRRSLPRVDLDEQAAPDSQMRERPSAFGIVAILLALGWIAAVFYLSIRGH